MKVTLKGRTASKGMAQGEALVCRKPFMFLSHVDFQSGLVNTKGHEVEGQNVKGKVVVFPYGCGSTGEEQSLLFLKEAGAAPKAIIAGSAVHSPGVIGAILAEIPMVYGLDQNALGLMETGDHVKVDANCGIIEVTKKET
jgi:predicted aconitase with swiveling domain